MDATVTQLLRELDSQPPFAIRDVLQHHLGHRLDARGAELWLAGYEQRVLRRWAPSGSPPGEAAAVEDSPIGEVYRRQRSLAVEGAEGPCVYAPMTIRAERLGVIEIGLRHPLESDAMRVVEDTATILAYVLLAARRYTDVFERVRRQSELQVPAELQWELLPVLAHDGPDFVIAGALEPAYDIGGDNFDYAVDPQGLTVAITDAMGHGTAAALLCCLEVAVHRNARRRGHSLRQQVRAANRAVHEQYGGEAFLTQLAFRIDRHDGSAVAVNAGHSYAFLLRGDVVKALELDADLPIGLYDDAEYTQQQLSFAPSDRLLLVTDGILEAMPDEGEPYGSARTEQLLLDTAGDHPTEVVRKLTRDVMAHRAGQLLDDATAVCVDYRRRR